MGHIFPSQLAYAEDTTQGTPPENATAWVADGTRVHHISLDVSGVKIEQAEDMRSQVHIHDVERMVKGVRNSEVPYGLYLTGTGVVTASGAQVAETDLAAQLRFGLGGVHRSNSAVLSGVHTTTTIDPDSDASWAVGGHVAVEDPDTGLCYIRRLVSVAAGVWTLDQALPFTPVDDDVVHGAITIYYDHAVMASSNGAGGPYTQSWWIEKGDGIPSRELWELRGAVTELGTIEFPRNDTAKLEATIKCASWIGPSESVPEPVWVDDESGEAPQIIGPDTELFLQDYGTATGGGICAVSASITPGVPRLPTGSVNTLQPNMHAICDWHSGRAEGLADIAIAPFVDFPFERYHANAYVTFRIAKVQTAGSCFAVTMPRAEIKETPTRNDGTGEISGSGFQLRAHRDLASVGTTELARSRMSIVIA